MDGWNCRAVAKNKLVVMMMMMRHKERRVSFVDSRESSMTTPLIRACSSGHKCTDDGLND